MVQEKEIRMTLCVGVQIPHREVAPAAAQRPRRFERAIAGEHRGHCAPLRTSQETNDEAICF